MNATRTGIALTALLAATAAGAAEPTAAPTAAPAARPDAAQSLRVVRDKETGRLRAATAQEMAEMDAAARAERVARGEPAEPEVKPLVVRVHPNGMRSAVLGPEYMVLLRAKRDANGRLVLTHDDPSMDHAAHKSAATE